MRAAADDGVWLIVVEGEIDPVSAPHLHAAVGDALEGAPAPVVLDLGGVSFLDSTGAGALLDAARRLTRAGRQFAVACPDGPPRQALRLMRLLDDLHVVEDRETAHAVVTGAVTPGSSWFIAPS